LVKKSVNRLYGLRKIGRVIGSVYLCGAHSRLLMSQLCRHFPSRNALCTEPPCHGVPQAVRIDRHVQFRHVQFRQGSVTPRFFHRRQWLAVIGNQVRAFAGLV